MQDYIHVLTNNYANFAGRARRREYWMFLLCNIIVAILLMIADGILFAVIGIGGLSLLYTLGVIVPGIAVSIRRLHDVGKSGWWLLLGCVPIAGLVLLVFMLMDGEPGDNAWGRNPKGITSVSTQASALA